LGTSFELKTPATLAWMLSGVIGARGRNWLSIGRDVAALFEKNSWPDSIQLVIFVEDQPVELPGVMGVGVKNGASGKGKGVIMRVGRTGLRFSIPAMRFLAEVRKKRLNAK